jgi:plasmid stability protein
VVRNLEESVKLRLQRRAQHHGRSLEEEVRDILRKTAAEDEKRSVGLGTKLASLMEGSGIKFTVEEVRGNPVEPAAFDE